MAVRSDIRLALPSKGRLEQDALHFMEAYGLSLYKPNPCQYQASVSAIPQLAVLFQRPAILSSARSRRPTSLARYGKFI